MSVYTIAGRQFQAHQLSLAVLGSVFVGPVIYSKLFKRNKPLSAKDVPPLNAKSKEEEEFILKYIEEHK
ncbi:ATP synthase subunit K, mitochondrial [Schizosaccharomyces pombe]|uniref:ATP synthase subunit K, mitochondrial n=1 Tax=Schizosaccharomyces pombe (strain 972 / ATCC 24843) TaxID=284812 RepID=ATP19_SCHPO|nr:putative F0-ATPase subunit K [Schizosaccharomyces pombe]C6Y4A3.1 RecName: Full=ATP synthase subunit K, mitochondrial [Schizosaccharomyces pombe 972h-]CBA11499.1 F0-ATPase subunit K (predicted) [Schizosaccharomyces pombe]|eukprot:NP_001343074.1 putative F0-ATPase subunit K [Schizosaccharomyces pombe]